MIYQLEKSLALAALSILLCVQPAAAAMVPLSAPTAIQPITLSDGRLIRNVRVTYATVGSTGYFIFPSFSLISAQIKDRSGDLSPLFTDAGTSNWTGTGGELVITMRSWESGRFKSILDSAFLKTAPVGITNTQTQGTPDVGTYTAQIQINDPSLRGPDPFANVGQSRVVDISNLGGGDLFLADRFDIDILIPNGDPVNTLLQNAAANSLRLRLSSTYKAQVDTSDLEISGETTNSNVTDYAQKLISSAGTNSLMFIPVGGGVTAMANFVSDYRNSTKISLFRRAGSVSSLAPEIEKQMFDQIASHLQLTDQAAQVGATSMVTFVLSNGITLTMPFGKVTELSDEVNQETKDELKTHLQKIAKNSGHLDFGLNTSANVIDLVSGSFAGHLIKDDTDDDELTQDADTFRDDINSMKQHFGGSITTISAMDLQSIQQVSSSTFASMTLAAGTFTDMDVPLNATVPFTSLELDGHPNDRDAQDVVMDRNIFAADNSFSIPAVDFLDTADQNVNLFLMPGCNVFAGFCSFDVDISKYGAAVGPAGVFTPGGGRLTLANANKAYNDLVNKVQQLVPNTWKKCKSPPSTSTFSLLNDPTSQERTGAYAVFSAANPVGGAKVVITETADPYGFTAHLNFVDPGLAIPPPAPGC